MREKRLSRQFVRYRTRGDVAALTAVFDATAPELLGLARHLVQSPSEAEDVVQATFLTAIERSATYDAAQPLRPWLTGILVRKAHQANARTGRRVEPDRVDERAPADPVERATLAEFSEDLQRALAALPERYRRVLTPFLHGGERPQEIALRQGIAPGTVRVQIHRGLEQLRRALPPSYAIGAGAATVSTAALGRLRASVQQAAPTAPAAASAGSGSTLAWIAPRALAGTAAVALVGIGVWQVARPDVPARTETPVVAGAATGDGEAIAAAAAPSLPEVPGVPLASAPDAGGARRTDAGAPGETARAPGEPWVLAARVTGVQGPTGAALVLSVEEAGTTREATIIGDGPLRVPLAPVAGREGTPALTLSVRHPAYAPFEYETRPADVRGARTLAVEVVLERSRALLAGRVVACSDATPVVAFYPATAEGGVGSPAETTCAEDGSFRLYPPPGDGWFVATAAGCAPRGVRMELAGVEDVELGTLTLDEGASIAGVAYFQGRPPDRPGTVEVHNVASDEAPRAQLNGTALGFLEGAVVTDSAETRSDADGAFRIAGLTPGLYDVLSLPPITASGYYDPHAQGERIRAPAANLELDSPMRVYTLEVLSGGEPVPDATVKYNLPSGSVAGPTKRDGSYAFTMASTDFRHRVEVTKPGYGSRQLEIGPGDFDRGRLAIELERTAPPSELTLELAVDHGPVGRLGMRLSLADSPWYSYRVERPAGTALAYGEVPAGRHRLEIWPEPDEAVHPAQQSRWLPTELELECRPSTAERVRVPLRQGGRVAFVVPEPDEGGVGAWRLRGPGAEGALWLSAWDPAQRTTRVLYSPADIDSAGEYWLQRALAPGEYHLDVALGADHTRSFAFFVAAAEPATVVLELD